MQARHSFEDRIVGKQAARISAQQMQIGELADRNHHLEHELDTCRIEAMYWAQLQHLLIEHPMLRDEWERFVMFVKLHVDPKDVPGFTKQHWS